MQINQHALASCKPTSLICRPTRVYVGSQVGQVLKLVCKDCSRHLCSTPTCNIDGVLGMCNGYRPQPLYLSTCMTARLVREWSVVSGPRGRLEWETKAPNPSSLPITHENCMQLPAVTHFGFLYRGCNSCVKPQHGQVQHQH